MRVELPSQGVLKPKIYSTVRLRGMGQRLLSIPEAALQEVDGKQTVFVKSPLGDFRPRVVEASVLNGRALLMAGLKEGGIVATEVNYYLTDHLQQAAAK